MPTVWSSAGDRNALAVTIALEMGNPVNWLPWCRPWDGFRRWRWCHGGDAAGAQIGVNRRKSILQCLSSNVDQVVGKRSNFRGYAVVVLHGAHRRRWPLLRRFIRSG